MGIFKRSERIEKVSNADWEVDVPILKALTYVLKFIQTGITMVKGYPAQNAILKKDTLDKEIVGGIHDL